MGYNRRDFLQMCSTLIATSATVPAFLTRTALAVADNQQSRDRVLVVVQLTGGNDGLNTVVPYADEQYRRLRPKLHLAGAKLHKLDDRVGLHPSLGGLAKLFKEGQACVVQSVGYPNPNRSHFESMAIWHTAPSDEQLQHGKAAMAKRGWLAHAIDERAILEDQSRAAIALRIGIGEMPQALMGCRVQIPSIGDLDHLKRRTGLLDASIVQAQLTGWHPPSGEIGKPLLSAARASSLAVQATADQVNRMQVAQVRAKYPDEDLAKRLRSIAQLVQGGFPASIYFTEQAGFDTHSRQANTHANLLSNTGDSLGAFVEDMTKNAADRPVLVFVFSEFGRRAAENESQGTDHGTAAPVFLLGNCTVPGVHGPYPDLVNLVDGDPVFGVDFRAVYATILQSWLGVSSETVLGKKFDTPAILKSPT